MCDDAPDLAAQIKRRWGPEAIEQRYGRRHWRTPQSLGPSGCRTGKGRKRRIVGPVGWGQSLELPRASCRGGVNTKLGCNLSENTASRQTGIVPQSTNAQISRIVTQIILERLTACGGIVGSLGFAFGPKGEAIALGRGLRI